ncbi:META domain-containing protein [Microbulbifer sp. SA54]|uniref:META domain-containing protein n=1 Tax=Microbulbifer sp. SA54 TaxID=3401577 RepID=UPI003AAF2016
MPAQRHVHFAPPRPGFSLAVSLLLSLLISACSHVDEQGASPLLMEEATTETICTHQWLLESLTVDGREHKSHMFWRKVWRDRPYFTCDKLGFVRGSAGTNPYLGKFSLAEDGGIEWLKPPKISRMGDRRSSSELEQDFLLALPRVNRADLGVDRLILTGADGTRLEFQQTRELPPAGG